MDWTGAKAITGPFPTHLAAKLYPISRLWSGRPVLKSRSEQLYEKAEEEGQRCRDWLFEHIRQLGRCGE